MDRIENGEEPTYSDLPKTYKGSFYKWKVEAEKRRREKTED